MDEARSGPASPSALLRSVVRCAAVARRRDRRRARHEKAGQRVDSRGTLAGMKLPLATVLLSAAALAACGGATTRYVMRVDRTLDRNAPEQPREPSADIPAASYRPA